MLLDMINNAAMNSAAKEGKDSTTIIAYKDSSGNVNASQFKEVYFFPVVADSSLIKDLPLALGMGLPSFGTDLESDTTRVHLMNFDKNFALVVAHPPLGNDFTNTLHITDTSGHILYVSLDYIGITKGLVEGLPDNW